MVTSLSDDSGDRLNRGSSGHLIVYAINAIDATVITRLDEGPQMLKLAVLLYLTGL